MNNFKIWISTSLIYFVLTVFLSGAAEFVHDDLMALYNIPPPNAWLAGNVLTRDKRCSTTCSPLIANGPPVTDGLVQGTLTQTDDNSHGCSKKTLTCTGLDDDTENAYTSLSVYMEGDSSDTSGLSVYDFIKGSGPIELDVECDDNGSWSVNGMKIGSTVYCESTPVETTTMEPTTLSTTTKSTTTTTTSPTTTTPMTTTTQSTTTTVSPTTTASTTTTVAPTTTASTTTTVAPTTTASTTTTVAPTTTASTTTTVAPTTTASTTTTVAPTTTASTTTTVAPTTTISTTSSTSTTTSAPSTTAPTTTAETTTIPTTVSTTTTDTTPSTTTMSTTPSSTTQSSTTTTITTTPSATTTAESTTTTSSTMLPTSTTIQQTTPTKSTTAISTTTMPMTSTLSPSTTSESTSTSQLSSSTQQETTTSSSSTMQSTTAQKTTTNMGSTTTSSPTTTSTGSTLLSSTITTKATSTMSTASTAATTTSQGQVTMSTSTTLSPNSTTTPSSNCPSGCPNGIWSSWSDPSACTDTCGACGTQTMTRTCTSEASGCSCQGPSSMTVPCNRTPCKFPRLSCCAPAKAMASNGAIICGPDNTTDSTSSQCVSNTMPPTTTIPTTTKAPCCPGGVWSNWTASNACSDTCGSCGTQTLTRTCTSAAIGCPCTGDSTAAVNCNIKPCAYPRNSCCVSYKAMASSGAIICGPQPAQPTNNSTCTAI
ncbi:adhesion G protein-coupled receptor B3 [Ditylenchus destructor]|nr:adhesion G protein-coupled receptor B3 [Ditylenchus destructor]